MNVWNKRSTIYDNLEWTKKQELLRCIKKECKINKNSVICDVGTGTGILGGFISPFCKQVEAIDNSEDMLVKARNKNHRDNIVYHLMDVENMSFSSNLFDCAVSRMCFHHVSNPFVAINECKRILKKEGRLVICEAVPPYGSYTFYVNMFKYKEKRHVFSADDLLQLFTSADFEDINYSFYEMKQVSISNWLQNSGLPENKQDAIFNMWGDSAKYVKKGHNMKITNDDIFVDWLFIIASGVKKK